MDEGLRQEIDGLRKLKTKDLKARYLEVFGESSASSNHAHLFRRVAWRPQARAEGGLSERARQRAAQLADDADVRLRAPRKFWDKLEQSQEDAGFHSFGSRDRWRLDRGLPLRPSHQTRLGRQGGR